MQIPSRLAVNIGLVAIMGVALSVVPGIARQRAAARMAKAANEFVSSLTAEQRAKAVHPLASPEWTRWNFIPASMFPRNGISFKELNQAQRQRAHDLMKAGLSQSGYTTAASVMQLENVLREMEGPSATAGAPPAPAPQAAAPAAVADQPAGTGAGARGEGGQRGGGRGAGRGGEAAAAHRLCVIRSFTTSRSSAIRPQREHGAGASKATMCHCASRSTTVACSCRARRSSSAPILPKCRTDTAPTPAFASSPPRRTPPARSSARSMRRQQAIALVAPKPRGFASGTTVKFDPQTPVGLAAAQMSSKHRDMLMKLIDSYASIMPPDIAAERMARIKAAGIDKIMFAWSGATEKGQQYQYQVQGPTFLIEHNNTQNNGNHIHAVWRDFNGDFGRDVLAEHMAALPH